MEKTLCIVAIVERGKADYVVEEAKKSGAKGASIFYGRGTGEKEAKKFFDLKIESSKEMILILSEESLIDPIYNAIINAANLKEPGTGIIFTLEVDNLIGLHHRREIE